MGCSNESIESSQDLIIGKVLRKSITEYDTMLPIRHYEQILDRESREHFPLMPCEECELNSVLPLVALSIQQDRNVHYVPGFKNIKITN
ncbi:hypothetical protein Glove_117g94 [Diversispora epigaea]|uniref:Uncharacterized protein n=1 Tax=Diversispora epigaea TaxID=1348612 RepID=A0A397J6W9_9GLOM|nr:hypothetical protein Glove_117g94 [Diversispora epigaea]